MGRLPMQAGVGLLDHKAGDRFPLVLATGTPKAQCTFHLGRPLGYLIFP